MECDLCMEDFDSLERRPKFLPCGHSYCLHCLSHLRIKACPVDQKVFQVPPDKLVDNFKLLNAQHSVPRPVRFWCITCRKEATDDCVEEHAVRSLKKQRAREAGLHLEALRRRDAALAGLGEVLEDAARGLELEACRDRLEEERAGLSQATARLQTAVEAPAADWEEAKQAALRDGLSRNAVQLVADLSQSSTSCTLMVRRGAGGAAVWTGEVRPADEPAARLLLVRLACSGALRPPQHQPEQQQEQCDIAPAWDERSNAGELSVDEMAALMVVGSRVARGRDWKAEYVNQDGVPPGPGSVTASFATGVVEVKWDRTGSVFNYRMKLDAKYELRLLPPPLEAHIGSMAMVLDICFISTCTDMKPKWKFLADSDFDQVRTLLGLHCDVDPAWSLTVLEQVAPHLKALQLVSPQQQHLDAALAMPQLEGLCVCNVTAQQLQQVVRMASLRRLELHCPPDAPLPALAFPGTAAGLRWLRCGVHPLVTALALVRAHADTLEELQLVAASTEPYGCPDLAAELLRCGLKKLKKIVLLRQYAHEAFCRHDKLTCKRQLLHISYLFSEIDVYVDVVCSVCSG